MNTAAIKAWQKRSPAPARNNSSKFRRQRRRRRRPRFESSGISYDSNSKPQELQSQHISESPPHQKIGNIVPGQVGLANKVELQPPSIGNTNFPNVTVQISQHSSFDKDLYIAYHSSVSTQGNSSSLPQHPDSGIGESSSEPDSPGSEIEKNGIVPDSQSLPGSSSYVPTPSRFPDSTGIDQPPPTSESRISPSAHSTSVCHPELSDNRAVGIEDSIEDISEPSSVLEVAESPLSHHNSQISKSEPAPSSTKTSTSSPFQVQPPSLPRSISDPAAYSNVEYKQQYQQASISRTVNRVKSSHGQAVHDTSTPNLRSQSQADFGEGHQKPSRVQVPWSADSLRKQVLEERETNSDPSLDFQTQVPLAFASQGTRVSITSAGKSIQQESIRIGDLQATSPD